MVYLSTPNDIGSVARAPRAPVTAMSAENAAMVTLLPLASAIAPAAREPKSVPTMYVVPRRL